MSAGTPKTLKLHKNQIFFPVIAVFFTTFLLVFAFNFLHPFVSDNSYASNTTISVSHSSEDWHIDAPTSTAADAGGLSFTLDPSADGTHVAKKDIVTGGNTNVPDYQIYVSVNTADGKMPATSGDSYIAATSGTVTDATDSSSITGAAALSNNSWGFALGSFNSGINYDDLVSSSTSESWSSSKWAKLPYVSSGNLENESTIESNAIKIYDSTSSSTNSTNVYYAIHANNDLSAGEYETKVTYTTIGLIPTSANTMQSMDAAACANLLDFDTNNVEGTTYEVTDSRDDQPYYIRKFNFGGTKYCTMVENLNLQGGTTITWQDSNIKQNTTTYLPGTGKQVTGTYTLPESSLSGFDENDDTDAEQRMYNGYGRNRNKDTYTYNHSDTSYPVDGAYYNWQVATAGTGGPYGTDRASTADICPKNWRLPTYSEILDITSTISDLGVVYWYIDANGTGAASSSSLWSGSMIHGGFYYLGDEAFWWSSAQGYNANKDARVWNDSNMGSDFSWRILEKYYGSSIRCLLPAALL